MEIGLECIVYSVEVNPKVFKPVLAGKYNIPNFYEKRELFEVISRYHEQRRESQRRGNWLRMHSLFRRSESDGV